MFISILSLKNKKGFTLIELMVTVAIISILTAIVVSNLSQGKAKARDAKRVSDIANIQLALEMFFDRCGEYPSQISNANYVCSNNSSVVFSSYMSQIPNLPTPLADSSYTTYADGYWVNATTGVTNYLLKTKFETANSSLTDSYVGTFSGSYYKNGGGSATSLSSCSTASLEYCVVPK